MNAKMSWARPPDRLQRPYCIKEPGFELRSEGPGIEGKKAWNAKLPPPEGLTIETLQGIAPFAVKPEAASLQNPPTLLPGRSSKPSR